MAKKTAATGVPAVPANDRGKVPTDMSKGWGGKAKASRTPSGAKIIFKSDEEGILRFVGFKDISERMNKPEGEIVYIILFDGARNISIASSYAFSEMTFQPGKWYYILNESEIDMGPGKNPMKDFLVIELGEEGEAVQCPPRIDPSKTLKIDPEAIALLNYTKLNYPLRGYPTAAV